MNSSVWNSFHHLYLTQWPKEHDPTTLTLCSYDAGDLLQVGNKLEHLQQRQRLIHETFSFPARDAGAPAETCTIRQREDRHKNNNGYCVGLWGHFFGFGFFFPHSIPPLFINFRRIFHDERFSLARKVLLFTANKLCVCLTLSRSNPSAALANHVTSTPHHHHHTSLPKRQKEKGKTMSVASGSGACHSPLFSPFFIFTHRRSG